MATDKVTEKLYSVVPPMEAGGGTPCQRDQPLPRVTQQRSLLAGGLPFLCKSEAVTIPCTHHSSIESQPMLISSTSLRQDQPSHHHILQLPKNFFNNHCNPQSPTCSDISSIILPSGNDALKQFGRKKPTLPPLVPYTENNSDAEQSLQYSMSPFVNSIPDISPNLFISSQSSTKISARKRSYSTSPALSDLTEFSSLIRGSPNSLVYGTGGYFSLSPNSTGSIGHLVGQSLFPHPSQFTIKQHKTFIEQNQNFNDGTCDTTITNKITYTEQPLNYSDQLPHAHTDANHAESMETNLLTMDNTTHSEFCSHTSYHQEGGGDINHEEPILCQWDTCTKQHATIGELVQHIEKMHIEKGLMEEYTCLWRNCPRSRKPFNARYKLVIHMRIHSGEKPNKCTYLGCSKAFSRLENLKIHLRTHTGEKPYVCQYPGCSKSFSNSSDRSKHQKTHYEQKPYACNHPGCEKRYTDPSSLRKHSRSHTQIKKPRNQASEPLTNCLYVQHKQLQQKQSHKQHKVNSSEVRVKMVNPFPEFACNYTSHNSTQQSLASCNQFCQQKMYFQSPPPEYPPPYSHAPFLTAQAMQGVSLNLKKPEGCGQHYLAPTLQYLPSHPPPPYDDNQYQTVAHNSCLEQQTIPSQYNDQTMLYYQ